MRSSRLVFVQLVTHVNAKAEPTERAATAIVVNFMMCLLVQDQSELRKYDTEFGCVETRILEF